MCDHCYCQDVVLKVVDSRTRPHRRCCKCGDERMVGESLICGNPRISPVSTTGYEGPW